VKPENTKMDHGRLAISQRTVDLLGCGFVSGDALVLASLVAGLLWKLVGPPATFIAGALFAALAAFGITFGPGSRATSSG
jgi:hypothetical protein